MSSSPSSSRLTSFAFLTIRSIAILPVYAQAGIALVSSAMPGNALIENNRRSWDERVAIHRADRTGFYAVERFLAGEKELHAIERAELGDVTGKRLLHLQCHFGLDTLILARHGAIATGLDFSPRAIEEARRLAV